MLSEIPVIHGDVCRDYIYLEQKLAKNLVTKKTREKRRILVYTSKTTTLLLNNTHQKKMPKMQFSSSNPTILNRCYFQGPKDHVVHIIDSKSAGSKGAKFLCSQPTKNHLERIHGYLTTPISLGLSWFSPIF